MAFKRKLISGLTLSVALLGFNAVSASAQDTNPNQDQMQKQERRERRGFGKHQGFGKDGKHRGGDKMMRGLHRLNLTDAQKQQVKTLHENFRTANQPLHQELRSLVEKKRDGVITEQEQSRLVELRTQLKDSAKKMHESVLAILTAEQRAQLEQFKAEGKRRKEERRQMRQNRGDAPKTENK